MSYDPYRIRVYNWKFFGCLGISAVLATPFVIASLVPDYLGPFKGQKEFQDRTVIVTGATGNLGAATCLHYAKRKFRVIMACRDMEKCRILRRQLVLISKNNSISCRHLDLEDVNSINRFAEDMINNEPHINVLVNNAAIKYLKDRELTEYGIERMYFVNFLGHFLLTHRLLQKLEESAEYAGDSRIINVLSKPKKDSKVATSDINFDARKYKSDLAYKQSKLALAYFTILLEKLCCAKNNKVYVYGASPCFKAIKESTFQAVTAKEQMLDAKNSYHKADASQASSNMARLGIDPRYVDRYRSGKLYSWVATHWGWGVAGKDETRAKHVWNEAIRLLVDIAAESKKKDADKPETKISQVQKSDQASPNKSDQINKV